LVVDKSTTSKGNGNGTTAKVEQDIVVILKGGVN